MPFEFDVHAMIFSEDAPSLEKQMHRHFLRQQVNKVNPRKEFFRLGITYIKQELEQLGVLTQWTMTAQAREYRETLQIEQQIRENPVVAAEWTRHQMEYEEVADEEVVIDSSSFNRKLADVADHRNRHRPQTVSRMSRGDSH